MKQSLYKGKFITLEGGEGVGKSTAIQFIKTLLTQANIPVIVTREPGGTPIAEAIRQVCLQHYQEEMCTETELLLFFASRIQHVNTLIIPALEKGTWVLCDRFLDASYAYQGAGRGVPRETLDFLAKKVLGGIEPDLTLLLDAPTEVATQRMIERGKLDRIEQEEKAFFTRVRSEYLTLAQQNLHRMKIIQAHKPLETVQEDIRVVIEDFIANHS